jgi:hypothetical protein
VHVVRLVKFYYYSAMACLIFNTQNLNMPHNFFACLFEDVRLSGNPLFMTSGYIFSASLYFWCFHSIILQKMTLIILSVLVLSLLRRCFSWRESTWHVSRFMCYQMQCSRKSSFCSYFSSVLYICMYFLSHVFMKAYK